MMYLEKYFADKTQCADCGKTITATRTMCEPCATWAQLDDEDE